MKSALVFPGQGSQKVGMGADVAEAHPAARRIYDQANDILGFDLAGYCFEGPPEKLEQTDIQQPAIFVTSAAIWAALADKGMSVRQFACTGGLSLGEYTALFAAGALSFEDALRLVRRRGELMQEAATAVPSGMVTLVGADEATAATLCEKARGEEILRPANFNCPGQIVVSGHKGACERAVSLASEAGCRAVALPVAGAFHSPLMEPAAVALGAVLAETPFSEPEVPVYANVSGERHGDAAATRDSLKRQVTDAVLWQRCVEAMIASGVERFVEVGPGKVLSGLLRKIDRSKTAVVVNSCEGIGDVE